jgi:hypothetical protein
MVRSKAVSLILVVVVVTKIFFFRNKHRRNSDPTADRDSDNNKLGRSR